MLSWLVGLLCAVAVFGTDLTLEPGHLKPFGEGGFSQPVEELDYFPSARDFFENYVKPLKPVKMKGAAKMSAAFGKWNDDYFLTLDESSKHQVSVETKKKENRQQPQENMQFKEFVKSYNDSEYYMVDSVPTFLRYCHLHCLIGMKGVGYLFQPAPIKANKCQCLALTTRKLPPLFKTMIIIGLTCQVVLI